MTKEFKIVDATFSNVNGEGTEKVVHCGCEYVAHDVDGPFQGLTRFTVPYDLAGLRQRLWRRIHR